MGKYRVRPLTPDRWQDLEELFGPSGGYWGCWCMYWRLPRSHFEDRTLHKKNKSLFRRRVCDGPPPGLLAYDAEGRAVGWVQVGPRADVPNWNGARRLSAPTEDVDPADPKVWGITCFVVRKGRRGQGVSTALLQGAIAWARKAGARWLEACPVEVAAQRSDVALYHGVASTFVRAGFREIARRRSDRPLLRLELRRPPRVSGVRGGRRLGCARRIAR